MVQNIQIRVLNNSTLAENIPGLAEILMVCVRDGASIGFMSEMPLIEAMEFWRRVNDRSDAAELVVLGAFVDDELAGTVQLIFSAQPNQPHKANVAKLLVSPKFRRLGIARQLMTAIEDLALEFDRDMLVLDTLSGTSAESLYLGLGWTKVGEIPRFAFVPEGGEPLPTSVFFKDLSAIS